MEQEKRGVVEQIADELRANVQQGIYGTNGRLPSIVNIASKWKTSRPTAYDAIRLLALEGVICNRGNSYYANYPIHRLPGLTPAFDSYLREQGLDPVMENMVEPEMIALPHAVAVMFGQKEGVHVVHRMRKQGTKDVPYRLAEIWYPASLAGDFLAEMRENASFHVLDKIKEIHGVFIVHTHEEVLTRIPTRYEAESLSLLRTAPVFELRRSNYDKNGEIVMMNRIVMNGSLFFLQFDYDVAHWS